MAPGDLAEVDYGSAVVVEDLEGQETRLASAVEGIPRQLVHHAKSHASSVAVPADAVGSYAVALVDEPVDLDGPEGELVGSPGGR